MADSDAPQAIDQYTILHLVGDMVGILDALGAPTAVIAGHDWGASIAWQAALTRPDRFRAVAALSIPFRPRAKARPTSLMPRTEDAQFYQLYFQEPGRAEAELERDPRATIRNMLFGASGDGVAAARAAAASRRSRDRTSAWYRRAPASCEAPAHRRPCHPGSAKTTSTFTAKPSSAAAFRGALNYYRNIDRNWEITGALAGLQVTVPALYIAVATATSFSASPAPTSCSPI